MDGADCAAASAALGTWLERTKTKFAVHRGPRCKLVACLIEGAIFIIIISLYFDFETINKLKMVKKREVLEWTHLPIAEPILSALRAQKLEKPLPIQIKSLKATLIEDKHVLGAARTGSGKTLAYAIPIVHRILTSGSKSYQLKKKIGKIHSKKEDFELIDGEMFSVEDMIVDRISDEEKSIEESDAPSSDHEFNSNDEEDKSQETVRSCPDAIVLVPTRELAVQVKGEFDKICSDTHIQSCCIIGGICQDKQLKILIKTKPQIIIATPGRLYDIIQSDTIDYLNVQSVTSVQTLVIDEADRMVQRGHFEEMLKIIDIVKESKEFRNDLSPYRVYMFSATLTFLHELPERFKVNPLHQKASTQTKTKKSKIRKPIDPKRHTKKNKIRQMLNLLGIERADTRVIDINDDASFGRPDSEQLTEYKISCVPQDKDLFLYYFLNQHPNTRMLIFCNSKDCLRRLANVIRFLGHSPLTLHSEMDQKKRLKSLEKFRQCSDSVLIATDVAARGLDIKDLHCVVHYQVPKTCESYIHRSGRTARVFEKGTSLTLCEPKEVVFYRRLCNSINGGKDLVDYEVDPDLKALLKDRIALAQQCDKLDHKLREKKSNTDWFTKAARECDIELDDEDIRQLSGKGKTSQQNLEENAKDRRHLAQLQKQLNALLKKPLITKAELMKRSANKLRVNQTVES